MKQSISVDKTLSKFTEEFSENKVYAGGPAAPP